MRLIVTRPAAQAQAWVDSLRALGVDAVALPLIGIEPLTDPAPLHRAWAGLDTAALAIFVSANAVQHFFAAAYPPNRPWPAAVLAGCTGPGTSAALRAAGLDAAQIAEPPADAASFDSEALWTQLRGRDWRGRRVLVVRGEEGRDWLADALRGAGAEVAFVAAYRRTVPALEGPQAALLAQALRQPGQQLWHFSSSEAARNLVRLAPAADWSQARALASHPRIAQSVRAAGFGRVEPVPVQAQALADWLHGQGLAVRPPADPSIELPAL